MFIKEVKIWSQRRKICISLPPMELLANKLVNAILRKLGLLGQERNQFFILSFSEKEKKSGIPVGRQQSAANHLSRV